MKDELIRIENLVNVYSFAHRRWHRHDEYHAGLGNGAEAGNWHVHGRQGTQPGHSFTNHSGD